MAAVSATGWWVIGYAVGGAVVAVAAALLLAIIALARRIAKEAVTIAGVLDAVRLNTQPVFEAAYVDHTVQKITRLVKTAAGESRLQDERSLLQKLRGKLPWPA